MSNNIMDKRSNSQGLNNLSNKSKDKNFRIMKKTITEKRI
jgi:hypothetical protein